MFKSQHLLNHFKAYGETQDETDGRCNAIRIRSNRRTTTLFKSWVIQYPYVLLYQPSLLMVWWTEPEVRFEQGTFLGQNVPKMGLPWWRSGWESACQCRGHGFEPWSGKIPHAAEQLGLWATITEPACREPVLRNKRGRNSERPAHHDEEWPPTCRN